MKHFEILVEDISTEFFLQAALSRFLLPLERTFTVRTIGSKSVLRKKIEGRLRGYKHEIPDGYRIIVLLDRDQEDCRELKTEMENKVGKVGLPTISQVSDGSWRVAIRIAIEELEAWYFGDWQAVKSAFPRVPANINKKQQYRNPDSIRGGTWEAFERIMKRHGYFKSGLNKIEAARKIGEHINPEQNTSRSFQVFIDALRQ